MLTDFGKSMKGWQVHAVIEKIALQNRCHAGLLKTLLNI